MGINQGQAPKDPAQRRRRNIDPHGETGVTVPDVPRTPPPAGMPPHPNGPAARWHPETIDFWTTMAESPQTKVWTTTDWRFLRETAIVHDAWMRAVSETGWANLERAVRARQTTLGMTDADRRRSRLKLDFRPVDADGEPQGAASQGGRNPVGSRAGSGRGRVSPDRFKVYEGGRDDDGPPTAD